MIGSYLVSECRTDCCFSPDDKLLVTGTSVKRDQGNGKLVFFDRESFQKVYEIEVASAVSGSTAYTHPLSYLLYKYRLLKMMYLPGDLQATLYPTQQHEK